MGMISTKCKSFSNYIKSILQNGICPKKKKNSSYIPMEFDDDDQHATIMTSEEIDNLIQKHKLYENKQPNINEYKIIKDNEDEDNINKKIVEEIKKEINEINIENEKEKNNENEEDENSEEEINKVKNDILNVDDD
jgi:hypothetical protein